MDFNNYWNYLTPLVMTIMTLIGCYRIVQSRNGYLTYSMRHHIPGHAVFMLGILYFILPAWIVAFSPLVVLVLLMTVVYLLVIPFVCCSFRMISSLNVLLLLLIAGLGTTLIVWLSWGISFLV